MGITQAMDLCVKLIVLGGISIRLSLGCLMTCL